MDKTYNDLMDIVNRTKKYDAPKARPKPRPTPVVEEEYNEPVEYDVVEEKPKKSKPKQTFKAKECKVKRYIKPNSILPS